MLGIILQGLQNGGQPTFHIHGAQAVDLIPVLGGHKGVRVPAIGHIHRVDMPNEHDGLSRLSAVEHRPDRGADLLRPVLGKIAVVGLQVHGAKLLGDVICQIDFMPVDAVDPNHIVPALDDLFHSDLLLSHI